MINIIKIFYKFFYSKEYFNIYTTTIETFVLKRDEIKIDFGFHLYYDFVLHLNKKKLSYKDYKINTKCYLFII